MGWTCDKKGCNGSEWKVCFATPTSSYKFSVTLNNVSLSFDHNKKLLLLKKIFSQLLSLEHNTKRQPFINM